MVSTGSYPLPFREFKYLLSTHREIIYSIYPLSSPEFQLQSISLYLQAAFLYSNHIIINSALLGFPSIIKNSTELYLSSLVHMHVRFCIVRK